MTNSDHSYVKFLEIIQSTDHPTLKLIKTYNLILNTYWNMENQTELSKSELWNTFVEYLNEETK